MHSILIDSSICDKFTAHINPVMKCLAKKGFSDNNSFLEFTAETISEIFASLLSQTIDETIADEPNRELEQKRVDLEKDIEKCKTEAQEFENEGKDAEAEELHKKMDALEVEMKDLKQRITLSALSQYSQTSQKENTISFTVCLVLQLAFKLIYFFDDN